MIVIIIGAVLLVVGLVLATSKARSLSGSIITLGSVVDLPASRGSKGGTTFKITAAFTDQQGQPRTYRSSWSSTSPGYRIGEPIRIAYPPGDPDRCGIASFGYAFGFATILMSLGLSLVLVGGAYRVGGGMMERWFPLTVSAPPLR